MTKENEKVDNGFRVDDIVKHIKKDIQGRIREFEWSGVQRAVIDGGNESGYYVIDVKELQLVSRPEKEDKNEEKDKKGSGKEDGHGVTLVRRK